MKKKVIHFLLITATAIALSVCSSNETDANTKTDVSTSKEKTDSSADASKPDTTDLAIGTTGYIITVPSDYYGADVTEEERRDDMIAYYKSNEHLMDFDVYQFAKDGKSLMQYTAEEAHKYGAKDFKKVPLGDIEGTLYYSDEEYNGTSYRVANYIFETNTEFGELSFWLDGDDANELVDKIISSFRQSGEGYDMIGMVMDKLPEDEYYNHYNVKGDNDEIFICNYNGDGELPEGTWVYMYKVDDGQYTIEVAYELKDTGSSVGEVILKK